MRESPCKRALVEQVALAVRHLVVLVRVVGEVLRAVGEHHAIDLGMRPFADQGHMLIDLGQPAAQGADRPLQRGVAADQRFLMGEVPDAGAPILQIHVPQSAPGPTRISTAPQCKPAAVGSMLAVSASTRGLGAFLQYDQGMAKIALPGRQRREHMQRPIDHDALGHVKHHAARPAGRMQRGKLVVKRINRPGEQIGFDLLAVLLDEFHRGCQRARLARPTRGRAGFVRAAVDRRGIARQIDAAR